jgi:hypothetical protein
MAQTEGAATAGTATAGTATAGTATAGMAQRLQALEDRAALKALVDAFSNLADTGQVDRQVLLFTPDATVISHVDGVENPALTGRAQIGATFKAFLGQFDTVYHINGQQTVEIAGDTAQGIAYCLVVLIGRQDGARLRTTMGVTYHDDYVRQDGAWLIARRVSHFVWRASDTLAG